MTKESVNQPEPPAAEDPKWLTCDGGQLRKIAKAGLQSLERHRQAVNDLNVFPVPDGDTGTNMVLTMRAAISRLEDNHDSHVGRVAQTLSHGALMGARGNSGVILSQIWRGLARGLKDKEKLTAEDLAQALRGASDTAYKGVMRPVEGTILTVIREGAEEAADAVTKSRDLRFILDRVLQRCQQALDRTPEMLPVLKQAGVVDAGGQGLVYLLEGMLAYAYGDTQADVAVMEIAPVPAQALAAPAGGLENPYDVQYILYGNNLDLKKIRAEIDAMGDSTVVVGDDKLIKVHVHVKDPGLPISYGIKMGHIGDVVVENMQTQMEQIIGTERSQAEQGFGAAGEELALKPGQIGVVAVAAGDGLAEIYRSLGAAGIVNGGQSNNPSTEEIYQAVQSLPTDHVIILPNNKNIILAAEAVRDLSDKDVAVVPTKNAPQAISALLCLDHDGEIDAVVSSMMNACQQVSSGEIAVATRSAELHGVSVAKGDVIGVANGQLCASSSDIGEVLKCVLTEMNMEARELVSIYYGDEVSESQAEELAEQISALYPEVEVELLRGGQSVYQYVLGAE